MAEPGDVTELLRRWGDGDGDALAELAPRVYQELRRLAGHLLRNERDNHSLQGTALVHEAYLRLVNQHSTNWQNRAQFFAVAAQAMRRILVDHARRRQVRPGSGRVPLEEALAVPADRNTDLVALDMALQELAAIEPAKARVVELRYFGGLTIEQIAAVEGISPATVKRHWTIARAWLYRKLEGGFASR